MADETKVAVRVLVQHKYGGKIRKVGKIYRPPYKWAKVIERLGKVEFVDSEEIPLNSVTGKASNVQPKPKKKAAVKKPAKKSPAKPKKAAEENPADGSTDEDSGNKGDAAVNDGNGEEIEKESEAAANNGEATDNKESDEPSKPRRGRPPKSATEEKAADYSTRDMQAD